MAIGGIFSKNVLYFPGCLTKYVVKDVCASYITLLEKLSIEFLTIPDIRCCGAPATYAGYFDTADDLRDYNKAVLKKNKVKKVIVNCPHCAVALSRYGGLEVEHISQTLMNHVDRLRKDDRGLIAYHDPCNLARKMGITEEPRTILKKLGYGIVEFKDHGKKTFCCGAGGNLADNAPHLANKIALTRLKQCKVRKLVTTCPLCYKHLKENASGIEVLEFSQVIEID